MPRASSRATVRQSAAISSTQEERGPAQLTSHLKGNSYILSLSLSLAISRRTACPTFLSHLPSHPGAMHVAAKSGKANLVRNNNNFSSIILCYATRT